MDENIWIKFSAVMLLRKETVIHVSNFSSKP